MIETDWLKRWGEREPGRTAVTDADTGRSFTYAELDREASRMAVVLREAFGVGPGDRVAILAENRIEHVFLYFASQRLGAILVPLNARLALPEVEGIVLDCAPRVLVHSRVDHDRLVGHGLRRLVPFLVPLEGEAGLRALLADDAIASERVISRARFPDPCMILYTSGTSGSPKGVLLSHETVFWNSVNTTLGLGLSQDDVTIGFLPFSHTGAWNVLALPLLHRGARLVLLGKFDPDRVLELCAREKATLLFGVPTTLERMARSPSFATASLASLRFAVVGGERCGSERR